MRDFAFMVAWLVLVPLALQGAQFGVLLWVWTSLLAPNDVLFGYGAFLPYAKISAGVTLVMMLAGRGGGIRLNWNATLGLLLALTVIGLVSQIFAQTEDKSVGWDLYEKFAKILLLAMVVMAVMRDRLRLHALMLAICLGIGFTGIGEGGKYLLSGSAHRVVGSFSTGDNNQIALDVLMILPMLQYLGSTARMRAMRLVCFGAACMCGLCVISTASRAGFIGLCLYGVGLVVSSRRKGLAVMMVAVLAVAGAQFVSTGWVTRMNSINEAEDDESVLGRIGAWKQSTDVALSRPLTGGGFHAIQFADVWLDHRASAMQLPVLSSVPIGLVPRAAHSIYFEILGDLGFLGLGCFGLLFFVAWRNGGRVRALVRRSGRADLAWAAHMANALRTSVLLFVVIGASLSAAYYDVDYILVAMLAALRDLIERTLADTPAAGAQAGMQSWAALRAGPARKQLEVARRAT